MKYTICSDCEYCKTERTNEQGQVRCTSFSQYVNKNDKTCEAYQSKRMQTIFVNGHDLLKGGEG